MQGLPEHFELEYLMTGQVKDEGMSVSVRWT